jgi:AcrR family transcriptional regulator
VKAVSKRIRRTPGEARETLLAVARARLLEHGLDGLKITDVANAAGMSHATLIHHFGSSAGMRQALVERMANELLTEFLGVLDSHPPSPERRGEMLGRLFDTLADDRHAQLFAWIALEAAHAPASSPFDADTGALLERFIDRLVEQKDVPAADRRSARFGVVLAVTSAIGLGIAAPWLARMHLLASTADRARFAAWLGDFLGADRRPNERDV